MSVKHWLVFSMRDSRAHLLRTAFLELQYFYFVRLNSSLSTWKVSLLALPHCGMTTNVPERPYKFLLPSKFSSLAVARYPLFLSLTRSFLPHKPLAPPLLKKISISLYIDHVPPQMPCRAVCSPCRRRCSSATHAGAHACCIIRYSR